MNFSIVDLSKRILISILTRYGSWIPDKPYLKILYRLKMGHPLNLRNPESFTEKLQWLKLYDRNPNYTALVDKAAVKEIVAKEIGREHIIPTIAVYENVNAIDWDKLPEKFVLKTTHGGGGSGVVVCSDKSKLDRKSAKERLKSSMKADIYAHLREWPYKGVPKRIIAEEFIDGGNGELKDYKFFCFNGEAKFFKIDFGRFTEHHANYYDLNWNLLPFGESKLPPVLGHIEEKPQNFDQMIEIVRKLSVDYKFSRIDLYNVKGKIYFGEITFYPASGLMPWTREEDDIEIGSFLKL